MSRTLTTHVSTGAQEVYPITFVLGYLKRDDVHVYTGEVDDYDTQLSYVWVSDTDIQVLTPPIAGEPIHIRRLVQRNALVNEYNNGAILRETDLDASHTQHLMILEEMADGFLSVDGVASIAPTTTLGLDMGGYRIVNMGDGVEIEDAVTLHQLNILEDHIAEQQALYDSLLVRVEALEEAV